MDTFQYFFKKVLKTESCWFWQGSLTSDGYGKFRGGGKHQAAHRASYVIHKGNIPINHVIDHICRQRNCVNPDHLQAITHRENVLRGTGPTAINAKKTHCINGHDLSEGVAYPRTRGGRLCRKCVRIISAQWHKKNPEKSKEHSRKYKSSDHAKEYHKKYYLENKHKWEKKKID